jgi:hypothetical protein
MSSSQSLNITELLGFRLPLAATVAVFAAVAWLWRELRDLTCDDRRQAVETAAFRVSWVTICGGVRPCAAWSPVRRVDNSGDHHGPVIVPAWHLLPRVSRSYSHESPGSLAGPAECIVHGSDGPRA